MNLRIQQGLTFCLGVFVTLSFLLFQNCSDISHLGQSNFESSKSQESGTGNGSGYDGKIRQYVQFGDCGGVTAITRMIQDDGKSNMSLVMDNCAAQSPVSLEQSDWQMSAKREGEALVLTKNQSKDLFGAYIPGASRRLYRYCRNIKNPTMLEPHEVFIWINPDNSISGQMWLQELGDKGHDVTDKIAPATGYTIRYENDAVTTLLMYDLDINDETGSGLLKLKGYNPVQMPLLLVPWSVVASSIRKTLSDMLTPLIGATESQKALDRLSAAIDPATTNAYEMACFKE